MMSFWKSLWRWPPRWRWLILPLGGWLAFLIGIGAWAGFNGTMRATSTNEFCYGCHIGRDTVVEEYQASAHFANESGVAATCADCHIPHEFVPKLITKVKATADVYHQLVGTINLDNFESHRGDMAEAIWQQMEVNDSKACRNCHDPSRWQTALQSTRAQKSHNPEFWEDKGLTCINCHRGVAHRLPK